MKQTKKAHRVPEYLPPRRLVEQKIVDDTYARNIQRNIEKHKRQSARIEAEKAKELQKRVHEKFHKDLKREQKKVVTPLNHCASSMMHSEAWNEMRKNNSPNTTGNKEGIAHNKKMREAIGTFKMPHSPLNQDNKTKKDSLGKEEAWAKWEKGYLDRTHKFKGTKFEKPITREENIKEMESERSEFMYDPKIGQIRLRKKDDADQPIERKSSRKIPGQDLDKVQVDERGEYAVNIHNRQDTIRPADGKNFKPFIKGKQSGKMPSGYLSDDDYTIKNGKISPLNKEGKKDACYHKVKAAVKVWPSAYASGQLVQCRKRGASNWGVGKKK